MNRGGLVSTICLAGGSAVACLLLAAASQAGVIATANAPFQPGAEIFTADPYAGANANRGLTTTRELYQTFKNPADLDVKKISLSFRVTNNTTGLQLKFYEVADTTATNIITSSSLGNLIHTIQLPAGTYANSSQRLGVELTGSDIFTLPQRDAGTTGYAISISQIDQSGSVVSGNLVYTNSGDLYANGKIYQESGAQSSPSRDAGLSISSAPEPTSAVFAVLGLAAVWGASRRRQVAG
jgi:MYXO-CTERM domain-containing protein